MCIRDRCTYCSSGQKKMFGIEEYFDGIRYLDISSKNSGYGYNISIYRILWHRIIWDTPEYDITKYRDTSCDIKPDTSKHQANANLTKPCHLVAVYSWFFRLCLCPHLRLSSVWPFSSCFCCPSARHIIGLTVPLANGNLVNSGLGLPPERMMFVFVSFFTFLPFFFLFVFLLDTWYLVLTSLDARYMICYCC